MVKYYHGQRPVVQHVQNPGFRNTIIIHQRGMILRFKIQIQLKFHIDAARWAPTNYKWSYNLYKWPYKWVTGVITLLMGVITPFITDRGPPCGNFTF